MIHATTDSPLEAKLLRVYCVSGDKADNKALHEAVIEAARAAGIRGASVLSAKIGFSQGGFFFDEVLSEVFIDRQPLIVEIIDLPESIAAFMPVLHSIVQGRRLITLERACVVYYQPHAVQPVNSEEN